ncbi:EF-hand domain-containing protein [Nitratireductor sp. ZSWI3]|uniref:EF-hand domain-containing protein n=1 Tax=Nitratireductor sp. ZSWI3 TaxID=2966359 RepID=UPI00214FEEDD|nr:EF-hand domain-containing protein [Nitratireductor sp. ZSWI3]MCR4267730.1 EF-hand domain-containing protein [Nitratireductor sp. ZSWI3]
MKRKILLTALAASLVAGSAAVAQEKPGNGAPPPGAGQGMQGGPMMRGMARIDTDGDGTISLEEFSSRHLDRLKAADADGDGTLSDAELQDFVMKREVERKARRAARRLDVDGDGTVTLAEIESQHQKRFALMDANDDGKLEPREMRRGFRQMAGGRDGHGMRREMHHKGGHWGGQWGGQWGRMDRDAAPAPDAAPDTDDE